MTKPVNIKTTLRCAAILGLFIGATGCASDENASTNPTESESVTTPPAEEVASTTEAVIATVDVGYGTVRFHQLKMPDGGSAIVMSEELPNTYLDSPLGTTVEQGHTNLEIFMALQPDVEPPIELVEAQAEEAKGLGRANGDVIVAEFDKNASMPKSIAACEAYVYAPVPPGNCYEYTWGNKRILSNTSGEKALHVGQSWAYATNQNVTLGICNESNVTIQGRMGYDLGGDNSSAYAFYAWANVSAGTQWRWFNFKKVNDNCSPNICVGGLPSRYRVEGKSATGKLYHLRTGELQQNLYKNTCACIPC